MSAWEQNGGFVGSQATGDLDNEAAALEALRFAHEPDGPVAVIVDHPADAGAVASAMAAEDDGIRESLVTVPPAVSSLPAPAVDSPPVVGLPGDGPAPIVSLLPGGRRQSPRARIAALAARAAGGGGLVQWAIFASSIAVALPGGLLVGRGLASHSPVSVRASTNAPAEGPSETSALAAAAPSATGPTDILSTSAPSPPPAVSATAATEPAPVRTGRPANHGRRRSGPKTTSGASTPSNSDKVNGESTTAR